MKSRESICDRFTGWFVEATDKIKTAKVLFLKRAIHSSNCIVQRLACNYYRNNTIVYKDVSNLFAMRYKDLKQL